MHDSLASCITTLFRLSTLISSGIRDAAASTIASASDIDVTIKDDNFDVRMDDALEVAAALRRLAPKLAASFELGINRWLVVKLVKALTARRARLLQLQDSAHKAMPVKQDTSEELPDPELDSAEDFLSPRPYRFYGMQREPCSASAKRYGHRRLTASHSVRQTGFCRDQCCCRSYTDPVLGATR